MSNEFQVMLATNAKDADLRFPLLASPKVDGFRGYVRDGRLLARSNASPANKATTEFFSHPALEGLDGELIVGSPVAKNAFQVTTSALRTEARDPKATFLIFDVIREGLGFEDRLAEVDRIIAALPPEFAGRVVKLEQHMVESLESLRHFEEVCLGLGFEGVIVRSPTGRYKQGRSTVAERGMLKIKRFSDAEAVVIGVEEEIGGEGRAKGTLGALVVRDLKSNIEFNIGTGFTAAQRAEFWTRGVIGEIVKYKFFAVGMVTAPRFPVFAGFRAAIDMGG